MHSAFSIHASKICWCRVRMRESNAGRLPRQLLDSFFGVKGLVVPSEQSTPSHPFLASLVVIF